MALRTPLYPSKNKKIREVKVHIAEERCKGCNLCVEFCPRKTLESSEKMNAKGYHPTYVKNEEDCVGCGVCQALCPDFAIYLEEITKEGGGKSVS